MTKQTETKTLSMDRNRMLAILSARLQDTGEIGVNEITINPRFDGRQVAFDVVPVITEADEKAVAS